MSRRKVLAWLSGMLFGPTLIQTAYGQASEESAHTFHQWVEGPFYLMMALTYDEPYDYAPTSLLQVEHCLACGVLRLPALYWRKIGKNLAEGDRQ